MPTGICLDKRNANAPSLLITAREQQAVKRFALDGSHLETIALTGAHICRPVIHGQNCYFSVLKSNRGVANPDSGFVMILDENNAVVSCPGATAVETTTTKYYRQKLRVFQYPHDVCVDRDENLYVPNGIREIPTPLNSSVYEGAIGLCCAIGPWLSKYPILPAV